MKNTRLQTPYLVDAETGKRIVDADYIASMRNRIQYKMPQLLYLRTEGHMDIEIAVEGDSVGIYIIDEREDRIEGLEMPLKRFYDFILDKYNETY